MERKLLDYLPHIMSVFAEFKEISRVEQLQVEDLWEAIDKLLKERFLDSHTGDGTSRWESILDITPKATDSQEIRNLRIRASLLEDLPYTEEVLHRMLTVLCGEDKFSMVLKNSEYTLVVRLSLGVKRLAREAIDLCERMIPLNIILDISLMYNTHRILSAFRHSHLKIFTQRGCREEEIDKLLIFLEEQVSLLEVDDKTGNLYVNSKDGNVTGFEYEPDSGNLYYDLLKGGWYERTY